MSRNPKLTAFINSIESSMINDHRNGMKFHEIADKYGISRATVQQRLHTKGIYSYHRYEINSLLPIDSEGKAYFVGFLVADGTIYQNKTGGNYMVQVYQETSRRAILDSFVPIIGGKVYQQGTRNSCVWQISHRATFEECQKMGIRQNKSYAGVNVPLLQEYIPPHLLYHFWRGVIDGDGCISLSPTKSGEFDFIPRICLSMPDRPVIQWYKDTMGITTSLCVRNRPLPATIPMYEVSSTSSECVRICRLLYSNATIALEPKRKRANAIISMYS